ncbi:MAG TPA: hypothetical protein ENJ18_17415 [Nannocystis exedens]|nr:hypothetical protein [Nannocystis exedens]
MLGEGEALAGRTQDLEEAAAQSEGDLDRVAEARADPLFEDQAVDVDIDVVALIRVDVDRLGEISEFAVDRHSDKTLTLEFGEQLAVISR